MSKNYTKDRLQQLVHTNVLHTEDVANSIHAEKQPMGVFKGTLSRWQQEVCCLPELLRGRVIQQVSVLPAYVPQS